MQHKIISFFIGLLVGVLVTLFAWWFVLIHFDRARGGPSVRVLSQQAREKPSVLSPPQTPPRPVALKNLQGRPSRGPETAPVTVVEFSDFHCPFCRRVVPALKQLMEQYPGKIRWIWKHYPLNIHHGAHETHEASECAAEQGKFWEFHDRFFENQNQAGSADFLEKIASETGLDKKKFSECVKSRRYQSRVDEDMKDGVEAGARGTPTTFMNGYPVIGAVPYDFFKQMTEHLLYPKTVPFPDLGLPQRPAPSPRAPVKFEDLDGKPFQGNPKASVTLVEFSDFHCPFCQRASETLAQLMKKFDGKIFRIWRHFPLAMHTGAEITHQASECAAEQGKFWEYHDEVFKNQGRLREKGILSKFAGDLKLDVKKFDRCLNSGRYQNLVQSEIQKGRSIGVQATPSFFINGKFLSGAQPYSVFESAVLTELKNSKSSADKIQKP